MNNSNNVSRMPSKKNKKLANSNDSDSDASTDSKGNIRDLIDYSSAEDKKPPRRVRSKRKAAMIAQKRIDDLVTNQANKVIYPKRNATPSKRKYESEQHALFDEMMESSEGSDYVEESEEESESEDDMEELEEEELLQLHEQNKTVLICQFR